MLDLEATNMIRSMYRHCTEEPLGISPQAHAGRYALNNMLSITFGFRTTSINDPRVGQGLRLSREFMNITGPVSNLVDYVPSLQKLPTSTRDRARRLHAELVEAYGGLIESTYEKMQAGVEVKDCLVKTMLLTREKESLDELDMAMLATAFTIGAVETVTKPSSVSFRSLTHYRPLPLYSGLPRRYLHTPTFSNAHTMSLTAL
jgi:Cytochrome P450